MKKVKLGSGMNKAAVVSFMLTLAILCAAAISGMFFTTASEKDADSTEMSEEQANINAVYFESAPTEEQLNEAISKATEDLVQDEATSEPSTETDTVSEEGVTWVMICGEGPFPLYDISAYIAEDDPKSKYQPIEGEDYGLDMDDIIAFATEKPNDIKCVSGTYTNIAKRNEHKQLLEFKADVNKYTYYTKNNAYKNDILAGVYENYFTPTQRVYVCNGEIMSVEPNVILSKDKKYFIEKTRLYQISTEQSCFKDCGKGEIADYGIYEGRKAVRVTGIVTDLDYVAPKTLTYTYERIYDIETGCLLETISYDKDGSISGYELFTDLVFADEMEVPEFKASDYLGQ